MEDHIINSGRICKAEDNSGLDIMKYSEFRSLSRMMMKNGEHRIGKF